MPAQLGTSDPGPANYKDWYAEYCEAVLAYAGECGLQVLPADKTSPTLRAYYSEWRSPRHAAEHWVDYSIGGH